MSVTFTPWGEDGWFLGCLKDFPDTWTQGEGFDDLKPHRADLAHEFTTAGLAPAHVSRTGEVEVA